LTPHDPQLLLSEFVFVHMPPHEVNPVQVCTQLPPMHDWPEGQALPHIPQFRGSVLMFVQAPPQAVSPPPQLHCPLEQVWPDGQTCPQLPQLAGSFAVLTHAPLHADKPVAHAVWHWPAEQTWLLAQA
jgi:hypothetical protein